MADSRFDFSDQYSMRIIDDGSLLAFFNFVDTELGLEFKDWALRDGKNGVFVVSASRQYENNDGETKYSNYVQPNYDFDNNVRDEDGIAYFDELTDAALAEFERRKEEGETGGRKKSKGRKSSGSGNRKSSGSSKSRKSKGGSRKRSTSKRSGRGPVNDNDAPEFDDGDDDDLPF